MKGSVVFLLRKFGLLSDTLRTLPLCMCENSEWLTNLSPCMDMKGFSNEPRVLNLYLPGSTYGSPMLLEMNVPNVAFAFLQGLTTIFFNLPTSDRSWPK